MGFGSCHLLFALPPLFAHQGTQPENFVIFFCQCVVHELRLERWTCFVWESDVLLKISNNSKTSNLVFNPVQRRPPLVDRSRLYHMCTRWTLDDDIQSVANRLLDTDSLPFWWPQFLESETLEEGNQFAENRLVRVLTKGWLPYKLRFCFRVVEVHYPDYFRLRADGDFEGVGEGRLQQAGHSTIIDFDWNIRVHNRLLYYCSMFFKPLFTHNHRWLMAQGEQVYHRNIPHGPSEA
jgi:hypothetical protein